MCFLREPGKKAGGGSSSRFYRSIKELPFSPSQKEESVSASLRVENLFPMKVPEFYLKLMDLNDPGCPIRRQAIPQVDELDCSGHVDPLGEKNFSLTKSLLKKYPKRAVFLVTSECAMFCRFCNRKRFVGKGIRFEDSWEESFSEMERLEDLEEVILSGGDPLVEDVERLKYVLGRIQKIKRIKIVRISTRVPVVDPETISRELIELLKKFAPLWMIVHINHPREVTQEFKTVVRELAGCGLPILSQTVLLRGVNDCARILIDLFQELVSLGVKPYYLFQLDEVIGARHFKVKIEHGIKIYETLKRLSSGLAIPSYVVDLSGGLGKVPVKEGMLGREGDTVFFRTFDGNVGSYLDDAKESDCIRCGTCKEFYEIPIEARRSV
ncbi:MAG: KamA family radical SAM protein [Desulfobacterota bacterium]|nr:KamA family radical SAM protein [Thermodesulfobacteriota bacterium]MDW8002830.1 KamA family radical SAM protein [Deltaproteobacteria bacterium]